MSEGIKNKTVSGFGWSAFDNIINYGITFIIGIILARLLSPAEYGLIGIIMIFISIFNTIVDGGFSTALIRKKDVTNTDYNTVFIVNLCVSVCLAVLLFFSAPLIARYFQQDELVNLTRVMSSVIIINAFILVQKAILTKRINFKIQTKISIISHVSSGVVGIVMAFCNMGVWALVGQQLLNRIITAILFWIYNKWRPTLEISFSRLGALLSFSWKLLTAQIINSLWQQVYQVVIGKYYQAEALGQYTRSKQFATLFSSNLTEVVRRVSFPVFSELQDDRERMLNAYRKVIKVTMLVTFVMMLLMAAVSKPLILVLIGEKWEACIVFLQILCFTFVLYPIEALNVNMLTVQGKSGLLLILEVIQKVFAVGPVLIGIFVNINWMLVSSMIVSWLNFFLIASFSGKEIGYTCFKQLKDIMPSFVIAITMAIPVWLLSFTSLSPFILLPIQLVLGLSIAILLCVFFKIKEYYVIQDMAKEYISKVFKR